MEPKKGDEGIDEKDKYTDKNCEELIFNVTQKLPTTLKNKENLGKVLEDATKKDFPNLQKICNEKNKQSEEKTKKIEELTDTLKRLQAEFENFKKRTDKEKAEMINYANAEMIANLLPLLDTFEIAFKNTNDKEKFVEGMKMVYAQFHSLLEAEGLRPIKAVGEKFDPYRHEVLLKEKSEKPEDTIMEEFQKGYMLNDKVVRHSKVKISGK